MHCVYILTNKTGSVLYTGVTSDLRARLFQHKEKVVPGFTRQNNVDRLVYFECGDSAMAAFEREKAIKGWVEEAQARVDRGNESELEGPVRRPVSVR